jgi:hypothetical protein
MYLLSDDEDAKTLEAGDATGKGEKKPQINLQQLMMQIPPNFEKAEIHGVSFIRIDTDDLRELAKWLTLNCLRQIIIQNSANAAGDRFLM